GHDADCRDRQRRDLLRYLGGEGFRMVLSQMVLRRSIGNSEYRKFKRPFPLPASVPLVPPSTGTAGGLAMRPAGRTWAAERLTRWSGLGRGDRPQTAASRSETRPRWARGSEQQAR